LVEENGCVRAGKEKKIDTIVSVDFLNVQGLTDVKAAEIERIIGEGRQRKEIRIIGILETHEKYRKINFSDNLGVIEQMRELDDKKGGGIMLIHNMSDQLEITRNESKCRDILSVNIIIGSFKFVAVIVYADVKEKERNDQIYSNLNTLIESMSPEFPKLIIGDFNGHVGFLGEQRQNSNGEMLLNFMEKWNLVMLNADVRCEGKYTRIEGNERSVIDYALVNEPMYDNFKKMMIDENKEEFDLSDHCYVSVKFSIRNNTKKWKKEWNKAEYYKVNDVNMMECFVEEFEKQIEEGRVNNIEQFEVTLKECADRTLKRTIRRKEEVREEKFEPIWMNDAIREQIKNRRKLNRMRRTADEPELRQQYWDEYKIQKEKVKVLVKKAKIEHEKKISKEIREDKTGKKMWDMIGKLKGERRGGKKRIGLYEEDGTIVSTDSEEKGIMMENWEEIYQARENSIKEIWNDEIREEYERVRLMEMIREREEEERRQRSEQAGRLYLGRLTGVKKCMPEIQFSRENIIKRLRKIKNGKSAGPDSMKGEIYKALINSEKSIEAMLEVYNGCLNYNAAGAGWKDSITKMIPKNRKPAAREHRPIALTNVGYKIFMGMIGDLMQKQEMCDKRVESLQSGFMEGRRLEENLFILSYCVEESYRSKEQLIVVSVDFKKAFDSIDRTSIVEAMKNYRCDPKVIDMVVALYDGDSTLIEREGLEIGRVEVKSGIRQGCTGSPVLFVMILSRVIQKLLQTGLGFRKGTAYIPVLFYADDGLLLASSVREAELMLEVFQEESSLCGLDINAGKSGFMIFNAEGMEVESIGDIKMMKEMKYLGVRITPQRDLFLQHRKERLQLAERMSNVTYSVVGRACDRLTIGKTYWKSIVLPSVLNASSVVVWRVQDSMKLQRIENGVWRKTLGAPSYTPIAALQGEVGCSSVTARDMKSKLNFARYIMESRNDLLRKVLNRMKQMQWKGTGTWIGCVENYMSKLEIDWAGVQNSTSNRIRQVVDEAELNRWKVEIEGKSSLQFYRMKERIGGEHYTSGWGSKLLFLARTNTINLNWRARFWEGDVNCPLCTDREETLEHFLLKCPALENMRREFNLSDMKSILSFGEKDTQRVENFLERLWALRWDVVGVGR